MQYFPAFLNIRQRPCLVVGGGEIAARKIDLLRRAGAEVSVIAPELCSQLADLSGRGQINHVNRTFLDTDVQNVALVIAATNSET
ncbi:MAG: siroheme synthase, partial [Candidatus Competibacteraceae bacterium]|nr:siroheme synthase [Candidatus Competibacteraceae bacterium]